MHAALILDDERLLHEGSMLNRLCVGLMGEGVQVTRVVPDSQPPDGVHDSERRMGLATRLATPFRVLPWMKRLRTGHLVERLQKSPPDVLYAVGLHAWSLATELGKSLQVPVILDVWTHRLVSRIPRGTRARSVAGFVVPTQSIAQAMSQRVGAELVSLVPMGVAARSPSESISVEASTDPTVVVLGDSRDVTAYRAMLAGLSRTVREHPRLQIFLELHGPHEHDVWREAGRLSLLGQISAVSDLSRYRRLLVGCQIVLLPERSGDLRSVVLEAMAQCSAFIVSTESPLDMFVNGQTGACVDAMNPDDWASAVLRLLAHADERRRLGAAAHRLVMAHHRSSNQVEGLLATFDSIVRGGAIPFSKPDGSQPLGS
jgi:hypothetical protein